MQKDKKGVQIGLGVNFILMIFVVLCMMILSLMAYREAYQKEKTSQRQKLYQQQYMKADADIQFVIHEVSEIPYLHVSQLVKDEAFLKLTQAAEITVTYDKEQCVLEKNVTDSQVLQVIVTYENEKMIISSYKVKERV